MVRPLRKTGVHEGSKPALRVGFVALTDCAPVVMAEELRIFERFGIHVELHREVGWATVREKILCGELDAAHAPAPMVVAASCGFGSVEAECLTGLVLSLNGNAITLSQRLWKSGVRNGNDLRELVRETGEPLIFGVVHSFSGHGFPLRQWLLRHGMHPDRDVRMVVVPPKQLPANLKSGNLDGYCAGEPWNAMAVLSQSGWCVARSQDLEGAYPEKVLMVRRSFAEAEEERHVALIAALIESCRICNEPEMRERVVGVLCKPHYVGVSARALWMGLGKGRMDEGLGGHVFYGSGVNMPGMDKGSWVVRSIREGGYVRGEFQPTATQIRGWFRDDIFARAVAMS